MRNICFPSQTRVFVFYPDRFYDTWVFLNNENAWLTASVREIERNREIFICLPLLQALKCFPQIYVRGSGINITVLIPILPGRLWKETPSKKGIYFGL